MSCCGMSVSAASVSGGWIRRTKRVLWNEQYGGCSGTPEVFLTSVLLQICVRYVGAYSAKRQNGIRSGKRAGTGH